MKPEPVYSARSLAFSYGRRRVLSCERFSLEAGRAAALVGPNGSGKTTFLKLLNGLVGPFTGSVEFLGRPLARNRLLRERSVYLHQHPVLFAGTVRDNLAWPLIIRGTPKPEARAKADAIAGRFGLGALLDRRAAALSGGETQRVALARAIVAGADVLLLDEPTSSMDEAGDAAVRGMLSGLKAAGCTLLFSTHDAELAGALADETWRFPGCIPLADGRP